MFASLLWFFSAEISCSKMFSGRTFFNYETIFKFSETHFRTNKVCKENNWHTIKRNRRYSGKPLSERRNCTFNLILISVSSTLLSHVLPLLLA